MTYGALLGGVLGRVWAMLVPHSDVGVFAAIGSAAVLAVTTQGPISSIVMVMELTHHVDAIMVPVLIAVVGASVTAQWMEPRSVYSAPLQAAAGLTVPPRVKMLGGLQAEDYTVVSSAASYAMVLQHMLGNKAHCFVVNEKGELVGELSPERLRCEPPLAPLEETTAADLARHVSPLLSSAGPAEVKHRLAVANGSTVPVIDADTCLLVGAVRSGARIAGGEMTWGSLK